MPILLLLPVVLIFSVTSLTWCYDIQRHRIHLLIVEKMWRPSITVDTQDAKLNSQILVQRLISPKHFLWKEWGEWFLQCFIFLFFAGAWYFPLNLPAPKTSLSSEFFAPIWSVIELVSGADIGFGPELSYNGIDCSGQLSLSSTKSAQFPLAMHRTGNKWHQVQFKKTQTTPTCLCELRKKNQ